MTKKLKISFLTLLFTFSNVGLPLTIHICNSMGTRSLQGCEMCSTGIAQQSGVHINEFQPTLNNPHHSWCEGVFPYQKIEDDYLGADTYTPKLATVSASFFLKPPLSINNNPIHSIVTSGEPPPDIGYQETYLYNSILII